MKGYYQFPTFESVYLEDSYVLDIQTEPGVVKISLEAVLTESHPQYSSPRLNEHYCYRDARICFPSTTSVTWVKKRMIPIDDPMGRPDYGNIDEFYFSEGHFHLIGEWGELDIVSCDPLFKIVE